MVKEHYPSCKDPKDPIIYLEDNYIIVEVFNCCDTVFSELKCKHEVKRKVWFINENDNKFIREQCRFCGYVLTKSFAKKNIENLKDIPIFNKDGHIFYQSLTKRVCKLREEAREKRRLEKHKSYELYLMSDAWKEKRKLALLRDNYLCQGCLKERATEVHHTTYNNLHNEFLFELISLCNPCHERYHDN